MIKRYDNHFIIIIKILEKEWKYILIQLVFEDFSQFKQLYAVFVAMKSIFNK